MNLTGRHEDGARRRVPSKRQMEAFGDGEALPQLVPPQPPPRREQSREPDDSTRRMPIDDIYDDLNLGIWARTTGAACLLLS
jgi:hypothetical protein